MRSLIFLGLVPLAFISQLVAGAGYGGNSLSDWPDGPYGLAHIMGYPEYRPRGPGYRPGTWGFGPEYLGQGAKYPNYGLGRPSGQRRGQTGSGRGTGRPNFKGAGPGPGYGDRGQHQGYGRSRSKGRGKGPVSPGGGPRQEYFR